MSHDPHQPSDRVVQLKRSRLGRLMGQQVLGIGTAVPDKVVTNDDLANLGYDPAWILQRSGIRQRRHVSEGQCTSDLATAAAARCIDQAGIDPADIGLVVVATYTPDMPMPATAALVQDRLGLSAMAYDLQAACTGFVFGLITGMQSVASGSNRLALVIGADCNSRIVDPADKHTYPLFGDGAGAVLVAPGNSEQGLLAYAVGADGSGADLLYRAMGGARLPFARSEADQTQRFLQMSGRPIFKWAVRVIVESAQEVLRAAQVNLSDVNLVVMHQANLRIIHSAVDHLGVDPSRVVNNVQEYGNTSAASIPLALEEAAQAGRLHRGDLVLLSGFGGGLTWGTTLMRW